MRTFTEKLERLQGLITAILGLLTAVGVDKASLLPQLWNPSAWGVWEPVFLVVVALIVFAAFLRQSYARASRLNDPNALRLDPAEPRHLVGRKDDIARVVATLPRRLIFLVGESGSGKTALLRAGVGPDPEVTREFVPVYIDLTNQDWDDGLLGLIRDRFRLALPDDERLEFPASGIASAADLLAAFDLYGQRLGRRPLLMFDQFDDYAAHHLAHFRDPENGAWRDEEKVADENPGLRLVRDGLAQRLLTALFASRREDQDALETVRMLPKPSVLRLDRPPTGSAGPIIDAVTSVQTTGEVVIENSDATWPALRRRIAADFEHSGQVLPQQLKLVLQGLRSLPRLTVGAYERAGGMDGLEETSVRDAIAAATRHSPLTAPQILQRILVLLVDADRRPPGKAKPRTAGELANPGLDTASVAEALAVLADREIVQCAGDSSEKTASWQLDHDYLARPILRLGAARDRAAMRYVAATGLVLLVIPLGIELRAVFDISNVTLVFVTAILAGAVRFGRGPSLFASLIAGLAYNFFFLPPLYTFTIADPDNFVSLFFFGIVAVVVSNVAALERSEALAARRRARAAAGLWRA